MCILIFSGPEVRQLWILKTLIRDNALNPKVNTADLVCHLFQYQFLREIESGSGFCTQAPQSRIAHTIPT